MKQQTVNTRDLDTLNALLHSQCEWSDKTFGPVEEAGPVPPLKHLRKEVDETLANLNDPMEWADMLLLLIDAARRNGITFAQLIAYATAKHDVCKHRKWNVSKWTYDFECKGGAYRCLASNGNTRLIGYGWSEQSAKCDVQKMIREQDREPHEHMRELPANHV